MSGSDAFEAARAARLRDERTAALAGRGRSAPVAGADHALVALGRRVLAVPMTAVAGVATPGPVGRLPGAHPAVRGIGRIDGRFALVVEAAALAGQPSGPEAGEHLLVLRHEPPVALVVDRVLAIRFLPASAEAPGIGADGAVVAVHRLPGSGLAGVDTVAVVDVRRLLAPVLAGASGPAVPVDLPPDPAPAGVPPDPAPAGVPPDPAPAGVPPDPAPADPSASPASAAPGA